jgi:hypothetical protein
MHDEEPKNTYVHLSSEVISVWVAPRKNCEEYHWVDGAWLAPREEDTEVEDRNGEINRAFYSRRLRDQGIDCFWKDHTEQWLPLPSKQKSVFAATSLLPKCLALSRYRVSNSWMDEWVSGWMDGWVDGRVDGRMNKCMNGWMNEWINW